jgi:predicted nucleic acid-binding protein
MTVVSNTTPLNYLVLIGRAEILKALYERVVIPQAVFTELTSIKAPDKVRAWITTPPGWLTIEQAPNVIDSDLDEIQIGERQAILLAELIRADFIVLDDRKARRIAMARGLNVIGTVGILTTAAEKGLITLSEAFDDLKQTSFRASDRLLELLVRKERE